MLVLQWANLGIRFILELCVLASLGYWGFQAGNSALQKALLGIGAPLAVAIVWSLFVAPKASLLIPEPYRFILEIFIFGAAYWALTHVGKTNLALILGIAFLVNRLLMMIWKQ